MSDGECQSYELRQRGSESIEGSILYKTPTYLKSEYISLFMICIVYRVHQIYLLFFIPLWHCGINLLVSFKYYSSLMFI